MNTDDETTGSFRPCPRREPGNQAAREAKLRDELAAILQRTEYVKVCGRDQFTDGDPAYDVASMALIRFASLLERTEFASFTRDLTPEEIAAIKATRNIAAHAGYRGMNDDLFWTAITVRVPAILRRLLRTD